MSRAVAGSAACDRVAWGVALAALIAVPWFTGSYYHFLLSLMLVNVIAAVGLNLLIGNGGQISLCNSSFMAIGAYGAVYLNTQVGLSYWLALPCGGLLAAVFGLVLGLPALRVRGFYLAVVTLAFLEITQILIEEIPSVTGGVRGMAAPRPEIFGFTLASDLSFYYVILVLAAVAVYCAWSLLNSPTGRALNAIRTSEAAAQTLGIPLARTKIVVFVISAFYAGISGALFAPLVGFIDPLEFGVWTSIAHVVFIVVGGLGSIVGAILGAGLLTALPEILRGFQEYNELIYGVAVLFFLTLMPKGLVGIGPWIKQLLCRLRRAPADASGRVRTRSGS